MANRFSITCQDCNNFCPALPVDTASLYCYAISDEPDIQRFYHQFTNLTAVVVYCEKRKRHNFVDITHANA